MKQYETGLSILGWGINVSRDRGLWFIQFSWQRHGYQNYIRYFWGQWNWGK